MKLKFLIQNSLTTDTETLKTNLNQLFLLVNGSLVVLMQVLHWSLRLCTRTVVAACARVVCVRSG